jgi:hypothetical protein
MEILTMVSRTLNAARYFGLLATGLFVAWGLYAAQLRGYHGIGGFYWFEAHTTFTDARHGWPVFFLTQSETFSIDDSISPFTRQISCVIAYRVLAADVALWLAMVVAAVYIARKMLWSGWRFNLSSLFATTTVMAVMLAWWRVERADWQSGGSPELTALWNASAGTPLLRLLDFPPYVYVPVLFGMGCLVMCAIHMASAATMFVVSPTQRTVN